MSIILEALKKSENQRQRQSGPGFATVPERSGRNGRNLWPLIVVILLAINTVILAVFLLRGDDAPASAPLTGSSRPDAARATPGAAGRSAGAATQPPDGRTRPTISRPAATPASADEGSAGSRPATVARAPARQRDIRSLEEEAAAPPDTLSASPPTQTNPAAAGSPSRAAARQPASSSAFAVSALPTATELFLRGELTGQQLNLDLHVYYPEATRRVVFVNGRKYREGERLASGPMVREIVPEGVILTDGARKFLLQAE